MEQARFSYDPAGRRVEKVAGGVTIAYTYDRIDILREVRGSTTLKYVHGPGLDEALAVDDGGQLSYFHTDALGSIVRTTNTAGAVTLVRQYDAWGNLETGSGESGYAFTGREWDPETGLYYHRARYYSPASARFLAEDPIRFDDGVAFYAYVGNNPPNYVDSLGLQGTASGVPNGAQPCGGPRPSSASCSTKVCSAMTHVRAMIRISCGGSAPQSSRGSQKAAGIDPTQTPPYVWYLPSGDSCVDYCRCTHENFHLQQAERPGFGSTPIWRLECEAYRRQLTCLREMKCCWL